jgi:cytochrome c2
MKRLALLTVVLALAGCDRESADVSAAQLTDGNPARGRAIVRAYGCTSCHVTPGVRGDQGLVGPPLTGMASRGYIAGVLVNEPKNMIRWIRDPQGVDSLTAMPNMGVSERDARDIAGYLYTLK